MMRVWILTVMVVSVISACKPEVIKVPDLDTESVEAPDPEQEALEEEQLERLERERNARSRAPRFNEASMIKKLKESGEWIDPSEMANRPTPVYGERFIPGRMIDPGAPPEPVEPQETEPTEPDEAPVVRAPSAPRPKYIDENERFDRRDAVRGLSGRDGVERAQGYQPEDASRGRRVDDTGRLTTRRVNNAVAAPANVASDTPGLPAMPGLPVIRRPASKKKADPRAPVSPRVATPVRPGAGGTTTIKP